MKFGKKFIHYQIPEWTEYYLDYFSLKTLLKFIDNRKIKRNGVKKLKKLKHNFSEGEIKKNKRIRRISTETSNSVQPLKMPDKLQRSFQNLKRKNFNLSNSYEKNPSIQSSIASETTTINLEKKKTLTPEMKKRIIKQIEDMSDLNNNLKSEHFIKFYEEKLKVVNEFFVWKLNDYEEKYLNTKEKIDTIKEQFEKRSDNSSQKSNKSDLNNLERDEFDFATSWKRALSSLFNFTSWLHSFHNINILAVKKIKKKAKKIFDNLQIKNIENRLNSVDSNFPFFNLLSKVTELRQKINQLYADIFFDGNLNYAKQDLEIKLRGENKLEKKTVIWFYYGCIIFSFLFFFFLKINPPQTNFSLKPFFPAYNFFLGIIFLFFGISINLLVLQKFKINYLYIFEVLNKFRIGFSDVYEISLTFSTFWCFMMIGSQITYNYELFGNNFFYFPLFTILFFFIYLLNPIKIFSYKLRIGLISTFFKLLFPFGKKGVLFRDFLYSDCLCSLTMPIVSLSITLCMLFNKECRTINFRPSKCNRDMLVCFIITIYPFCIRILQLINRLYYSKKPWRHLINILKYISTIIFIIFAYLDRDDSAHKMYKILKIIFGIIQCIYNIIWDIYVDWSLGRINSENKYLRDKLVYKKNFYYFAIISDIIGRFLWVWHYAKLKEKYEEWKILLLTFLEIARRTQWCIIRIENEETTNPEMYRTILAIPQLPELNENEQFF